MLFFFIISSFIVMLNWFQYPLTYQQLEIDAHMRWATALYRVKSAQALIQATTT